MNWFGILLVAHVALALSLLAPSIVLPFVLRSDEGRPRRLAPVLVAAQGTGTLWIAGGLVLTGAGLLTILGLGLLSRPWLLAALTLYAGNLVVAAFVSRPNVRRLLGIGSADDQEAWARLARRQRRVAYAMAAATGAIGLLMSTKPELW